jgi:hypothetical protein
VLIIASNQVNNYILSDKGRTSWTPDSSQPGYSNFCYSNREVTPIDNSTLARMGQVLKPLPEAFPIKASDHSGVGTLLLLPSRGRVAAD